MTRTLTPDVVAAAFRDACLAELQALKPGNVHRHAGDARMSVTDFERSADAAAPIIGRQALTPGRRIRLTVEATIEAVGHNTNLGIILLCAPLAQAALVPGQGNLKASLSRVLEGLSVEDARETYAAIRHANAGGLGAVPRHDVTTEPAITLLETMREAESRDRIAWNFTHGFEDIFDRGIPRLAESIARFGNVDWAVSAVYLAFLAEQPDTLIARRHGVSVSVQVSDEANRIKRQLDLADSPKSMTDQLLAFDRSLKTRGLNPGTSADLTVATLFASALEALKNQQ